MSRLSLTRGQLAAAGVALLLIGSGLGFGVSKLGRPAPATQDGRKVLYWYDPMAPGQHFDKPGKSPFMDMQLVPKYADEAEGAPGVRIDPARHSRARDARQRTHGPGRHRLQRP
jgi:membrane fusion protein, copper/silver efflux system